MHNPHRQRGGKDPRLANSCSPSFCRQVRTAQKQDRQLRSEVRSSHLRGRGRASLRSCWGAARVLFLGCGCDTWTDAQIDLCALSMYSILVKKFMEMIRKYKIDQVHREVSSIHLCAAAWRTLPDTVLASVVTEFEKSPC